METLDQVLETPKLEIKITDFNKEDVFSQVGNPIFLTKQQQQQVIDIWNNSSEPPSISYLVQTVFNDKSLNGKNFQGKIIKTFLATRSLVPKTTTRQDTLKSNDIVLTEEQKLYIKNNAKTNGPTELAKTLFNNSSLTSVSFETRLVCEYLKTLDPILKTADISVQKEIKDIPIDDYEAPKNFIQTFKRINQYLNFALDEEKLTPKQKREIDKVTTYLHTHRLIKQVNEYDSESDRKSFEDAFIRWTHDKEDLSQEEIDQYITLANEVVISFKIQRQNEKMRKLLEQITGNDPEHIKISMSLVDAISGGQQEYNSSVVRQQKLLNDLTEKRSTKMSKEVKQTSSILNLLNLWKEKEGRDALLRLADLEQQAIGKEVEKMEGLEEIKLKVLGLSKAEAMYMTL